jgi:hypothetical protein
MSRGGMNSSSTISNTSDETYLEAFIEHLATLPHEIRRNLELMKDLDKTCSTLLSEVTQLQREYIHRVEERMNELEIVNGIGVRVGVTTTGTSTSEGDNSNNDEKYNDTSMKREYDDTNSNDDGVMIDEEHQHRRKRHRGNANMIQNDVDNEDTDRPVIIHPTTEEFIMYIRNCTGTNEANQTSSSSSSSLLNRIQRIQKDCIQQAEEKVAIADQTYALIDNICKRLDSDIKEMEDKSSLLLNSVTSASGGGVGGVGGAGDSNYMMNNSNGSNNPNNISTAKPNDLAAIQVNTGSPDWILAKVISYDPPTGMYNLSDEDVESNKSKYLGGGGGLRFGLYSI